jgi:hypothetical protein
VFAVVFRVADAEGEVRLRLLLQPGRRRQRRKVQDTSQRLLAFLSLSRGRGNAHQAMATKARSESLAVEHISEM